MVRRRFTEEQVREILERYQAGESRLSIAASFGSKSETLTRVLEQRGVTPRHPQPKKFDEEKEREIARRYADGEPSKALMREYGCSDETLRKIVARQGITARPRGGQKREFGPDELQLMEKMARAGESQYTIAQFFGANQVAISRAMARHGIEAANRIVERERHGSWKGGRIVDSGGYVQVRVEYDDPMASMRNVQGYVMEHRLVMARHIGRPLDLKETVHHCDGDKQNNAIENLQLRTGNHGRGAAFVCGDCGSTNIVATGLKEQGIPDAAG